MIRTIVCTFAREEQVEPALSQLFGDFPGKLRVSRTLPPNRLAAPQRCGEEPLVTIHCGQGEFCRVVDRLGKLEPSSIRY